MKYVLINHGFMGSNIENWFPFVKAKLDGNDTQVIIPQYPIDTDKHFYEYWKKVLDIYKDFGYINLRSVIIGHSSGCAFTIKYLIENNLKIDKLILVSGFNNYYSSDENDFHNLVNRTFYIEDEKLAKVKELCNKIVCIYGDNDPYIPQDVFHDLALKLDAEEVIIKDGGHLNIDDGYNKFEEILKYI
jgi:predicted alpha/beta hydrolase family esterase